MKRFLVFAFDHFYPRGGYDDFVSAFDEWAGADQEARWRTSPSGGGKDYAQIVDTVTKEVWRYE